VTDEKLEKIGSGYYTAAELKQQLRVWKVEGGKRLPDGRVVYWMTRSGETFYVGVKRVGQDGYQVVLGGADCGCDG